MKTEESLIKVNSGLLAALSSGAINIQVLPKEILILECIIAGTSFRKLTTIEKELKAQVKLSLKRESKNEYDEFAIALYFKKEKTGYIPKTKNEVIARMMDAGKQFYAVLQAKEWEGNWLRLDIKVYLKD